MGGSAILNMASAKPLGVGVGIGVAVEIARRKAAAITIR
jgi:hypothetical protein